MTGGARKTDPVCGQTIDPLRARAVAIVAGERYYFCCVEHKARFAEDPAKFIPSLRPEIPLEEPVAAAAVDAPPAETATLPAPAADDAEPPAPEPTPTALTIAAPVPHDPTPPPHTPEPRPPTATLMRFEMGGMEGPEDAERVRRAMAKVPGVTFVEIDLVTEVASLATFEAIKAAVIIEAVSAAGYEAAPRQASARDDLSAIAGQARAMLVRAASTLGAALALLLLGGFLQGAVGIVTLALAAAGCVVAAQPMARDLITRLRHRIAGTELLTAIAATALLGVAAQHVFTGGDARTTGSALAVIAFALAGRWLEETARHAAGTEIAKLEGVQPTHARRVRPGEPSAEVSVSELVPGDLVRVTAGEPVPVDGVVRTGEGMVDESLVAGRSTPIGRAPGDPLVGGTLLESGTLIAEVKRVGRETVVARLRAAVVEAQGSSSAITRFAERAERWAGPAAILLAGLVVVVHVLSGTSAGDALPAAATVLVAVCPLAFGLATPAALALATARAARRGILYRNAEALQRAAAITTVVIDKSATLTAGRRRVLQHALTPSGEAGHMIALAAAAERAVEAPLARAIIAYAEQQKVHIPPLDKGTYVVGMGITAVIAGQSVAVGSRRLIERECGASVHAAELSALENQLRDEQCGSVVYVALDGKLAGALGIDEPLRDGAAAFVGALADAGLRVALVTGDGQPTSRDVAEAVGITEVRADLRPDEKKAVIVKLRETWGGAVAAVGDGIDDAAALAAADVGIALGRGAELALEAGAVTVLRGDLRGVVDALALAKRAVGIMRQNLVAALAWGAGASVLLALLPVAPFGWLAPLAGVIVTTLAVWGVVRNSLRAGGGM